MGSLEAARLLLAKARQDEYVLAQWVETLLAERTEADHG